MPATSVVSRPSGGTPVLVRAAIAIALPVIGAGTVAGTLLGKEVIVTAGWLALAVVGLLFVRPVVGVAVMTVAFLLAAYPTLFQALGVLTLNNLLGLGLAVLLAIRILETRDLSFLRIKQVRILMFIGLLLFIGTYVAEWQFPLLQASRGKMYILDKTSAMGQDFFNRLIFLVFFCVFVRTRSDVEVMFVVFMLGLYVAVPSALYNWMSGQLLRGFRAASSVTAGSNPNRLGMICLVEMALFWYWARLRPGRVRQIVASVAMAACLMVLLATGSRSGILGLAFLGILLQTGPRAYRVPAAQIGVLVAAGVLAVAVMVPTESWERMIRFNPAKGQVGASSTTMREETLERAWQMARDYPLFGVGLGNFREVSRQIYKDDFYRPPHNSYLWAMSEGGIFVLAAYGLLFWVSWKDIQTIRRLAHRDHDVQVWASALRVVFLLFFFYSLFADLWLNPLMYVMLGLIVSTKQYVESLPEVMPAIASPAVRRGLGRAA
jgi:O-antigen ligase